MKNYKEWDWVSFFLIGTPVIAIAIIAFAASFVHQPPANTNPKRGQVRIENGFKYCDGTTLVYQIFRSGSVVPNSPECK